MTTVVRVPSSTRLTLPDVVALGLLGIRGRPLRAALSAAGIAIGVGAMVAVLGIGTASRADLLDQIRSLGTNMLTVQPGQTLFGQTAQLPATAVPMTTQIAGVQSTSAVGAVQGATVRRTDRIDPQDTGGIVVEAAQTGLLSTLNGEMATGTFLTSASANFPVTVLGAVTASRLGIDRPGDQVFIAGRWFTVIGIMRRLVLAPDVDRAALIGWPIARQALNFNGHATTVYVRAADSAVERVSGLLAPTADPENPENIRVSRPSDALTAQLAAKTTFNGLFLGLGAVALLVGGVGVANIMVISVLERRQEIGLRRALGATDGQIRYQFLAESVTLSMLGGMGGTLLGIAITLGYAVNRAWPIVLPWTALAAGIATAMAIGAVAGLYPAWRASRLMPTEALATG